MNRNVLVFGEYGVLNGGENSFLAIAARLIERGWKFIAAVPRESPFESALAKLDIANVGFQLFDSNGVRNSQEAIRELCCEIIQGTHPGVVHCNSLSTSRLLGPVTQRLNLPSVGYVRDIVKLSQTAVADVNRVDRIVAVSNATCNWHIAQGIDAQKTVVIYNAVDTNRFHPNLSFSSLESELGLLPADQVLLFVGQIGMRKGIETLLEAFRLIHDRIQGVHLLIVGQRNSHKREAIEYEKQTRDFAAAISNDSSRILWLGRRPDVEVLMNRADLLVHAANQEPLGRVLLEAAACGLPFVATDVGGTREILAGLEVFDLMVPAKSPSRLADRVIALLQDKEQKSVISKKLVEIAETRFSVELGAERLNDVYYGLCREQVSG